MAAQPHMDRASAVARILANNGDLAALPQVVFKVMEITGTDPACAVALERAIVVDPGFSAKLLALANSAHFALPKKVSSIKDAIMFIGLRQVRQTAMAVGVFDMFLGKSDSESRRRRAWWRHSVDSATAAKALAKEYGVDENSAYTAGLLHWFGRTVLDKSNPGAYEKVIQLQDRGVPFWQAEEAVYGCDHRDVAMASAASWGFPEELVNGLAYYRRPDDHPEDNRLGALVAIGGVIADVALTGRIRNDGSAKALPDWVLPHLGISDEQTDKIIEKGLAAITAGSHLHF